MGMSGWCGCTLPTAVILLLFLLSNMSRFSMAFRTSICRLRPLRTIQPKQQIQNWIRPSLDPKIRFFATATSTPTQLKSVSSTIQISDAMDGGNIELSSVVDTTNTDENDDVQHEVHINIRADPFTELEQTHHMQSFYFRSTRVTHHDADTSTNTNDDAVKVRYVLDNAPNASYPDAWEGSTVFYTTSAPSDATLWRRKVDTYIQADGQLAWAHEHSSSSDPVYFAYFPPYSYERHLDFVAQCAAAATATTTSESIKVSSLGQTQQGRELDYIQIGNGPLQCYVIHRQHPGESMASFFAEGLLQRLLGCAGSVDGLTMALSQQVTWHIVPHMCPDGAVAGYLRTNAAGANLNREWASTQRSNSGDGKDEEYQAPTLKRSPEVYHVWQRMQETGVDFFLDVHGDEALPFNFLSGAEGTTHWGPRLAGLHGAFLAAYERANPDMQRTIAYEPYENIGDAPKNLATSAVANEFDCLAATLEMPFKDCLTNPDPERGWNPYRAQCLGHSLVDALAHVIPYLRTDKSFWEDLPSDDAYVLPTSKYK